VSRARATSSPGQERLWNTSETGDFLGIPVGTLNQWASRGVGPRYFKIGRHRRYHPADVKAWLDEHASRPAPDAA
jgi:hypothetical protein